jgi:hypothetical protein
MSRTTLLFHRATAFYRASRQPSLVSFQEFSTSKSKEKKSLPPKKRGRAKKKQADGPPLLIPPGTSFPSPASLPHLKSDRSHSESDKEFTLKKTWTFNASPLLDPQQYCKASASFQVNRNSKNGTQAAKSLNHGKQKLVSELQTNIQQYNAKRTKKKNRSFAMIGHGVPKQLLQNHVDMADLLLPHYGNASEISFKSFGNLAIDKLRVNNAQQHSLQEWNFDENSTVQQEMLLYLTVMNRMTCILSQVLWIKEEEAAVASEEESDDDDDDDDDDFVPSVISSTPAIPQHWKVELSRGQEDMQQECQVLLPIVEFMVAEKKQSAGRILIRLSGRGAKNTSESTTLVFHASFQNPFQQEEKHVL